MHNSKPNLSVNINKIATLRNARGGNVPNLMDMVDIILSQSITSITCHPRNDRRHITPDDVKDLYGKITSYNKTHSNNQIVTLNLEGDLREEFLQLVKSYPCHLCTFVPVSFGELTSHRGYNIAKLEYLFKPIIKSLHEQNTRVSIFIESHDHESLKSAKKIGADCVEIYTKPFCDAFIKKNYQAELEKIKKLADHAKKLDILVNAGHDLTYKNIPVLIKNIKNLNELSVGHHLISYALEVGIAKALKKYLSAFLS